MHAVIFILRFRLSSLRLQAALALCLLSVWPLPAGSQPVANGGGFCSAPALGAPCATGGLATVGNTEPLPGFSLDNPVHLATGNKYQLDIDLPANPGAPGLELVRHYNGLSTRFSDLGRNWTLSYDTRLQRRPNGWQLQQADGSIRPVDTLLPLQQGYRLNLPGGRQLLFDASGHLAGIRQGPVTLARILRHAAPHPLAGRIHRIESHNGQSLEFHYKELQGSYLLSAVDTPLGRFHYRYGLPEAAFNQTSPRLLGVRRPDGMERHYHYETELQSGNPYALTGISVGQTGSSAHRLTTWAYDLHGRVIRLQRHGQAMPRLHIDYVQSAGPARPGLTRIRSDSGAVRSVRYQRSGREYRIEHRSFAADPAGTNEVSHDASGRLLELNGLQLQRNAQGGLASLVVPTQGWPGLASEIQPSPGAYSWNSLATGRSTVHADHTGRPARLLHANGDQLQLRHDAQGRVSTLEHTRHNNTPSELTHLQWRGSSLQRIAHPFETETRRHDAHGRVTERVIQRPGLFDSADARFREAFHYDEQGRLSKHELPEGGSLQYQWQNTGASSALHTLLWEDTTGQRHTVIQSRSGRPGYQYGNGLELETHARNSRHADTLTLTASGQVIWHQQRRYTPEGQLQQDEHDFPETAHHDRLLYMHDPLSRLQAVQHQHPDKTEQWWYAWHPDGALAALNHDGHTHAPDIARDASGLPSSIGPYRVQYSPGRRLQSILDTSTGQTLAQYRHNAFGHRISKQQAGNISHYLYVHDQLAAEARSDAGRAPQVTRRYLYAGLTPVGMILYPLGKPPQLYAVHTDLSGAPRLLTDDTQAVRWLAAYTPTGQARRVAGDLDFPIRLPGQYEDPETGWHDNLLRTYLAESGQYLEPDPLGPLPGTQVYGYARQQPWRYADPHGLLLFAFDGTRYSADSMGNAWLLAQAYRDGPAHYHSGPGNSLFLDWDAVTAWQAGQILENQWQALLTSLERQPAGTVVPVDIIGFSRGAALGRHFGNRIVAHTRNGLFSIDDPLRGRVSACVDLRFMGLFDTVTQFGIVGSHNYLYDFGVSEMWSWVSHAVALHEHRWRFPLTSADAGGSGNVVEAPFAGAHADIGGGLALHERASTDTPEKNSGDSDLAKVALAWMHWQAQAASVNFAELPTADLTLQSPLLRDMRAPLVRVAQHGDRAVYAPSGQRRHAYQDDDSRLGSTAREATEAFITRPDNWRSQNSEIVGTVDMEGYARWLEETLGWSVPQGLIPAQNATALP